jgi:hypothetical protein
LSLRPVSLPILAASPFGKPPCPGRQVGEGKALLWMLSAEMLGAAWNSSRCLTDSGALRSVAGDFDDGPSEYLPAPLRPLSWVKPDPGGLPMDRAQDILNDRACSAAATSSFFLKEPDMERLTSTSITLILYNWLE